MQSEQEKVSFQYYLREMTSNHDLIPKMDSTCFCISRALFLLENLPIRTRYQIASFSLR